MFQLNNLPFTFTALEPYISAKTLEFHHGKHHQAYVDNLNKLITDSPIADNSLAEIVIASAKSPEMTAVFNNAAQVFNHDFFWQCLKPADLKKEINPDLLAALEQHFQSLDNFLAEFKQAALTQFGSGWAWLVKDGQALKIFKTANADTPLAHNLIPLLTIDVWEHAYYLDYQNRRADFIEAVLQNLINWDFVANNFLTSK